MRSAVRSAARLCLAVEADGPAGYSKDAGEPVTVADFGAQAVLLGVLATEYPRDTVIAEEDSRQVTRHGVEGEVAAAVSGVLGRGVSDDEVLAWIDHRGNGGLRTWAVDPLDGTRGYLRGDQFAVAVGLIVDGMAVAGVLGCPRLELSGMQGVMVWGGPGMGTYVEALAGGSPRRIAVSTVADPGRARILGSVEPSHGDPEFLQGLIDGVGLGGGWVRIDSEAKYAAVAAGIAEVYVRPRNNPEWRERLWDHAAGIAVLTGAGGRVTDLDGAPLDLTTGAMLTRNRGLLATNGAMHQAVLSAVAEST